MELKERLKQLAMKPLAAPEVHRAMEYVVEWECLPQFPRTEAGIASLAQAMAGMCPVEKMEWLSAKVLHGAIKCPTPLELRRICTIGKDAIPPLDGLEVEDVDMEDRAAGR